MTDVTTNYVELAGVIESIPMLSHELFGERFYNFSVGVKRLSDAEDIINATVSERLLDLSELMLGRNVELTGQFRSHNNNSGNGNKLQLSVFVKEVSFPEEETRKNAIVLTGYICKHIIYRQTPLGREIADILLAVNRQFNKSDYIPCIVWGRNARFAKFLDVGSKVIVHGRIQSREYIKKIDESDEKKIAYEVSVSRIESL
jgi:primosomal replication protein N